MFDGNKDYYGVVVNKIDPPIVARAVRIIPQSWTNHIGMRVDFYGCDRSKKRNDHFVTLHFPMQSNDRSLAITSALTAAIFLVIRRQTKCVLKRLIV